MSDEGLKFVVSADVSGLQGAANQGVQTIKQMEDELARLDNAITRALSQGKNTDALERAFDQLVTKIKAAKAEALALGDIPPPKPPVIPSIPPPDNTLLLNSLAKQKLAFLDLGRVITGQGFNLRSLAANFTLLGPGVTIAAAGLYALYEVLNKQTDAEKKAADEAKRLHDVLLNLKDVADITQSATGGEAGNIDKVRALAAAINDTNRSYAERKNALHQLQETNKSYFGDLSLEADSLKTLSERVQEYSKALIVEAIVKGETDEISNQTREITKQEAALQKLKDARDRAFAQAAKPQASSFGNVAGGGADVLNNSAMRAADQANDAFVKQRDVVEQLRTNVALLNGDLEKNIDIQLKLKPLKIDTTGDNDLDKIKAIRKEIAGIYADLAKPDTRANFLKFDDAKVGSPLLKSIDAEIDAVRKKFKDAANDPALRNALGDLIAALTSKANRIKNPDFKVAIDFTLQDPSKNDFSLLESKIEKEFGGEKGLELKIPARLGISVINTELFNKEDSKKIAEELQKDLGLANFFIRASPHVQLALGKNLISKADQEKLKNVIVETFTNTAAAGFKDVGVVFGDLLSGQKNPLQNAIKDFTTVLGDGLIKIGESLIAASSIMVAIKAALGDIFSNPIGGILEGVAAVALGEVVKNVGAHAFATGGIVTGPTLGLVGEAGPEVIFPLSQLNRFVQGTPGRGDQVITVNGRISGNDLKLALARTNKQQGLV